MTNSCYFFRKIRDMRPNNDARVDLKRRMIVLTGTRCTYFELKTTHKHSAWLYMLRFIATFLTNWYITPWQHNKSINRNKLWNSYLVCAIRHCSPACLVHNFRCQWYTVIMLYTSPWSRFELTTSVVIDTDCIGSSKSN